MSTTQNIALVIKAAIQSSPALSMFEMDSVYIGAPGEARPCISIDGTFSIAGKQKQRGSTLHIWMEEFFENEDGGDIHDIADDFVAALRTTPILPSEWTHQPEPEHGLDHIVIPVVVYIDAL